MTFQNIKKKYPPTSLSVERARLMLWAHPPIHFIHLYLLGSTAGSIAFYLLSRGGSRGGGSQNSDGFRQRAPESPGKSRPTSDPRHPAPPSPRALHARPGEGFRQDSLKTSPRPSKDRSDTRHDPPDTRPRHTGPVREHLKIHPRAKKTPAVLMVSPDLEILIFRNENTIPGLGVGDTPIFPQPGNRDFAKSDQLSFHNWLLVQPSPT